MEVHWQTSMLGRECFCCAGECDFERLRRTVLSKRISCYSYTWIISFVVLYGGFYLPCELVWVMLTSVSIKLLPHQLLIRTPMLWTLDLAYARRKADETGCRTTGSWSQRWRQGRKLRRQESKNEITTMHLSALFFIIICIITIIFFENIVDNGGYSKNAI